MIYKGYTIEKTRDEWRIKRGEVYEYWKDNTEYTQYAVSIKDAQEEIDELTESHDMEEPKTPFAISGDVNSLKTVRYALERWRDDMISEKMDKQYPTIFLEVIHCLTAIDQAIKDQKHDDEQLPFKS